MHLTSLETKETRKVEWDASMFLKEEISTKGLKK